MKKLLLTFSILAVAQTASANDCMDQAKSLVETGGKDVVSAYSKYQMNSALTAEDLNISEETLASLEGYVESGCAKDHLTKAMSTGSAMGGMFN